MAIKVSKVDVWSGSIADVAGALDAVLGPLAAAGANLECVIARRQADQPGRTQLYVTPLKGKKVQKAATGAGLSPAANLATLRVESSNKPGIGHKIMQAIANAGVNVRGISAIAGGRNSIAYIGFDNAEDAAKAASAIKAAGKK